MARPSPTGSLFPTNSRGFSVTHPSPASLWSFNLGHWSFLGPFPCRNVPQTVNIAFPPGFIGSSGRLFQPPDFTLYRGSLFCTEYVAYLFEGLPPFSSLENKFSTDASVWVSDPSWCVPPLEFFFCSSEEPLHQPELYSSSSVQPESLLNSFWLTYWSFINETTPLR